MRTLIALTLLIGCGDKAEESEETNPTTAPATTGEVDCSNADENPFAGTCVETFHAGCFDPSGTCDGTAAVTGTTELIWENGATVYTELDYTDPFSPTAITTLSSSTGAECAVGTSENNTAECASLTTYVRSSDGAVQTWCIQTDGSMTVTCEDTGEVVEVPASQSNAANQCQYSGDAEGCDVDVEGF